MTKGVKQFIVLQPNTNYTIDAVVSSGTAILSAPVAKAVNVSFAEGTSAQIGNGVYKQSGGAIASVNVIGCADFTFSFLAGSQILTITPVSSIFVGTDNGTFTITDANGQTSAAVAISITTTLVITSNNNLIFSCSTFNNTTYWSTFNTPTPTFGSSVSDPFGGTTAQPVTFPTNRTGVLQVLSPAPSAGSYTASIYARVTSVVAGQQFQFAYYHGDFPQTQVSSVFVPTTTWTRYGPFTFTVASGDVAPSVIIENIGGDNTVSISATETIQLFGFKVEAGSSMTAYTACAVIPAPVANPMSVTAQTQITLTTPANVTNSYTSLAISTAAGRGTAGVSGTNLTYQSNAGVTGADTFRFTATNSSGTSSPALVSVTVQAASALPARMLASWLFAYQPPTLAALQANAPKYNFASFVSAVGDGSSTGALAMDDAPIVSDITGWHNAGRKLMLLVGGSTADPGHARPCFLLNSTNVTQMYNSIVSLKGQYNFDGVDFDLEGGSAQFAPQMMANLAAMLKSQFGTNFIIQVSPAPFEIRTSSGIHAQAVALMGANCDLVAVQWYSQSNTDSWFINSYILPDLNAMINGLNIPASKILMGCGDSSAGTGGPPGGAPTYVSAMQQALVLYPTLRGAIFWQSNTDLAQSYDFHNRMGVALGL